MLRQASLLLVTVALFAMPGCFIVSDDNDDDDNSGEGGTGGGGPRGTAQPGDPCTDTQECIPGSICFNRFCVGEGTLRISLVFSVDSDYDLHVETPTGSEINFANRTANGGTLDVDQCISSCGTSTHVENVVFDGTAPAGVYTVWVENFDGRGTGPFTIDVAGDVNASFSGNLPAVPDAVSEEFTFTR